MKRTVHFRFAVGLLHKKWSKKIVPVFGDNCNTAGARCNRGTSRPGLITPRENDLRWLFLAQYMYVYFYCMPTLIII